MVRKLKIDMDTGSVKKSLLDLGKTLKSMEKSQIELMTPDTKKFIRGEAQKHFKALDTEIKNMQKSLKENVEIHKKSIKGSREELVLKKQILDVQNKINVAAQQQQRIGGIAQTLGGGGARAGAGGSFLNKLGRVPGLSGLGGLGRILSLGVGGAMAGAGAFGLSRLQAGFQTYEGGIPDRLRLMGRGVGDLELNDPRAAANVGLNAISMRRNRVRDIDIFGKSGATQANIIGRAGFERAKGIEGGTLAGIGGGLRQQLGGQGAQKAVMQIQAQLIASGISDAIGPWLESSSNMLIQLNEKGFTFKDSALSAFAALAKATGRPEASARLVTSMDQAIRGSKGEANAFFQTVFGEAGIGGGTIGGAQAAIRAGGIFGLNLGELGEGINQTDREMFEALGIGGKTGKKVARATLDRLDRMFPEKPGATEEHKTLQRLSRNRFMMRSFGTTSEVESAKITKLLETILTGSEPEMKAARKKIQDIQAGNTEIGNLKTINASTAGALEHLKHMRKTQLDVLGGRVAPAVEKMRSSLNRIDSMIGTIVGLLGGTNPEEALKGGLKTSKLGGKFGSLEEAQAATDAELAALPQGQRFVGRRQLLKARQRAIKSAVKSNLISADPETGKAILEPGLAKAMAVFFGGKAPGTTSDKEIVLTSKRMLSALMSIRKSSEKIGTTVGKGAPSTTGVQR